MKIWYCKRYNSKVIITCLIHLSNLLLRSISLGIKELFINDFYNYPVLIYYENDKCYSFFFCGIKNQ